MNVIKYVLQRFAEEIFAIICNSINCWLVYILPNFILCILCFRQSLSYLDIVM